MGASASQSRISRGEFLCVRKGAATKTRATQSVATTALVNAHAISNDVWHRTFLFKDGKIIMKCHLMIGRMIGGFAIGDSHGTPPERGSQSIATCVHFSRKILNWT